MITPDVAARPGPSYKGLGEKYGEAVRSNCKTGVGLKARHFELILAQAPDVDFFEIHAENYMVDGGPYHHYLSKIRERYPLSIHGVGLSIGGANPLDEAHLDRLSELIGRYEPEWFSEHLAWSSHGDVFFNDLLPLPYTLATLQRVCEHIDRTQERLKRRMLLENPATYVEFKTSTIGESEFLREVLRRTGCGLLLDVSNVHVSCVNHHRSPRQFIEELPLDKVGEIHLAGFTADVDASGAPLLIDSHGSAVDAAVWDLYATVVERHGAAPTLIEWDNDVPDFPVLLSEAQRAADVLGRHSACGLRGRVGEVA